MRSLLPIILALFVPAAFAADDKLVNLDTRPGVSVALYYMKREGASAAVVLLPGGEGNINIKNGVPASNNFLVRSREYFAANGFNVVVVGNPTGDPCGALHWHGYVGMGKEVVDIISDWIKNQKT